MRDDNANPSKQTTIKHGAIDLHRLPDRMTTMEQQSQYERRQQARLDANQAEKDRKLQEWTDRRNDADAETERNMRSNEAEARRIIADFERVGQESTANMRRNRG